MVFTVIPRTAHSIRVCRLYRSILKEQKSWLAHRGYWNEVALTTREAFKANKDLPRTKAIPLVEYGEEQLEYWAHPNPLIS